jgi:hypothetical protein
MLIKVLIIVIQKKLIQEYEVLAYLMSFIIDINIAFSNIKNK